MTERARWTTRYCGHPVREVLPTPVCDVDLSPGDLATRLDEGVQDHEYVVRAAIEQPVVRAPEIRADVKGQRDFLLGGHEISLSTDT